MSIFNGGKRSLNDSTSGIELTRYVSTTIFHSHSRKNLVSSSISDGLLVVILMGFEDLREISRISNMSIDCVESILSDLEKQGLVIKIEKGLLFKKTLYRLTSNGYRRAVNAYAKFKKDAETIKNLVDKGFIDDAISIISSYYPNSMWVFRAFNLLSDDMLRLLVDRLMGRQGEFSSLFTTH